MPSHTRNLTVTMLAAAFAAAAILPGASPSGAQSGAAPGALPGFELLPDRAERTMRTSFQLTLRDARILREGSRSVLRGRPVGRGRLTRLVRRSTVSRPPARSLAATLDGIVGKGSFRAAIRGLGTRTLRAPHMRNGILTVVLSGKRVARRRVGTVVLRGSVRTRGVAHRGGCALVPLTSCPSANLAFVDALFADLRGADLRGANLHRAYMHGAQLGGADLRGADLRGADLTDADLGGADLRGANLADATLTFARTRGANLRGAFVCATRMPAHARRVVRDCRGKHPARTRPRGRSFNTPPALPLRAPLPKPRGRRVTARAAAAAGASPGIPLPDKPSPMRMASKGCWVYFNDKDDDGDGLSDCYEATSRGVAIMSANGDNLVSQTNAVTTAYNDADSDDDGIGDGQEDRLGSDPTSADGDRDALSDLNEVTRYASKPAHADSDNDSVAPQGGGTSGQLFDGNEVRQGTSPRDIDSDGDYLSDYNESTTGGKVLQPAVANIPTFTIKPSQRTEVSFQVETTTTVGSKVTNSQESARMTASESSESHEFSVELGTELSQEIESESKVGVPEDEASVKVKLGIEESIKTGTTNSWENKTSAENESRKIAEQENSTDTELGPATCIEAQMIISAANNTTGFTLSDLQVTATTPDPEDATKSRILAVLQPVLGEPKGPGECPGTDKGKSISVPAGTTSASDPVTFAGPSSPETIKDFFADPKPITFELSNPTIVASAGVPFTDISTAVNSKDATIVVDYGSHAGGKSRLRSYQVAAAVEKQLVDGEVVAAGITADDALTRLGLSPRYANGKLVSLGGVANDPDDPNDGKWIAVGSAVGLGDDKVDFADVRITSGSGEDDHGALLLTYVDDRDDDGLSSLTEPLQGTTETNADTDHDGLTDRFETNVGWTVPLIPKNGKSTPSYKVHSSPLTCDPDGDGSPDGPGDPKYEGPAVCPKGPPEYNRGSASATINGLLPIGGFLGTDPGAHDTNKDGFSDGEQSYPQVLTYLEPGARAPVYSRQFGGSGHGGGLFTGATELSTGPLGQVLVAAPDDKHVYSYLPREGVSNPFTGQIGFGNPMTSAAVTNIAASDQGHDGFRGYVAYLVEIPSPVSPIGSTYIKQFHTATLRQLGHTVQIGPEHLMSKPAWTPHIATDTSAAGNIYLALENEGDISEYTPDGHKVRTFGKDPKVRGIAVDRQGNVFTVSSDKGLVKYSGATGKRVAPDTRAPTPPGTGVGVDGNGYVYMTNGQSVHKYSNNLTHLATFGAKGSEEGQIMSAKDVAGDVGVANDPCKRYTDGTPPNDNGVISVLDSSLHRVQQFVYPFGEGGPDPATRDAANCRD